MRYFYNSKATVEESNDLSVFSLKEWGMLKAGYNSTTITWTSDRTGKQSRIGLEVYMNDDPFVRLSYAITDRQGNSTPYENEVSLVTTPCNLGGVRYWFACPHCWERVAVLYLAPGDVYFRCRNCNNLSYNSRNYNTMESFGHTSRQIDKLRSEIKRWTWQGRPTRKVRRLQTLERKMGILSGPVSAQIGRLTARIR